jgi:DNA primase
LIRKSGSDAFRARVESAEDFFDFQINHNLSAAESKTTAGRVAFARKMSQFISLVPDQVVRDTLISRLSVRLTIQRDTLLQMVRLSGKQTQGRTIAEEVVIPALSMPRHDLAVICKAALVAPDMLRTIRQQPWRSILQHVDGTELISKIFESALEPDESSSIAAFFGSLSKSEAAILSLLLANKELNEQMGHRYWTDLATLELQRRRRQIETLLRLAGEDPAAQQQANEELKEVLDLESWFTDISRLPSPAP